MGDIMELCRSGEPVIMGIVNVTPDSFSDGGDFFSAEHAIEHGLQLLEEGAHILDIGGESTRPNADIISVDDEIKRVIPVIEGLAGKAPYISIDTRNSETIKNALKRGADIVNDISGLRHDVNNISVAVDANVPVCIMHMQGTPQDMQNRPEYENVIDEILAFFEERLGFCEKNGISKDKIILDPGIGFGKTLDHNLTILNNMDAFHRFGCPIMLGASRKSFIGALTGDDNPKNRLAGSLAAALSALDQGVQIFRVHDVRETKQAFDVHQAVRSVGS